MRDNAWPRGGPRPEVRLGAACWGRQSPPGPCETSCPATTGTSAWSAPSWCGSVSRGWGPGSRGSVVSLVSPVSPVSPVIWAPGSRGESLLVRSGIELRGGNLRLEVTWRLWWQCTAVEANTNNTRFCKFVIDSFHRTFTTRGSRLRGGGFSTSGQGWQQLERKLKCNLLLLNIVLVNHADRKLNTINRVS